ncbi:MAG TPA: WYL domain-containing protein [Candidatus Baltobacteraceae bacterium]
MTPPSWHSWGDPIIERTTEPKIVLLVRLLNAIDEGRHSFEALKERIAEDGRRPSTRSLRRYLAVLADADFPWYFDRAANAYRFADGYSLKRLELDGDELFGLVAMRSLGASLGGSIGAYIGDVTDKLVGSSRGAKERVATRSPLAFRLTEIDLGEQGDKVFELLSAAERSSRSVAFAYRDKEGRVTQRTVDPYGFVVSGGRVYCVAHDHARKAMRTFAVDSVEAADVMAKTFVKPSDFDVEAYAASTISGVLSDGAATEVTVRFEPRVAKAASAAKVVADRTVAQRDDGSVEIAYRVANADELVRWVLGWGEQAEIVAPESARARAREVAAGIAAKYN